MRMPKSTKFEAAPDGLHHAICTSVIDLGSHEAFGATKRRLQVGWSLPLRRTALGKPFYVTAEYNLSGAQSSALYGVVQAMLGDVEEPDLHELLGKPCVLQVQQATSNKGNLYAKVTTVGRPDPGVELPSIAGMPRVYLSLDPREFDREVFEGLPKYLKDKITETREYRVAIGEELPPEEEEEERPAAQDLDDSIPF
jgi:hypothetical protein